MNDQFNPDDVLKKMYAALNPAVADEMLKSSSEASEELTKVYQNMLDSYSAFLTQASTEVLDDLHGKLKDANTPEDIMQVMADLFTNHSLKSAESLQTLTDMALKAQKDTLNAFMKSAKINE
jgi:tRNA U54 and U55 pseudouridine synthase Pus10